MPHVTNANALQRLDCYEESKQRNLKCSQNRNVLKFTGHLVSHHLIFQDIHSFNGLHVYCLGA